MFESFDLNLLWFILIGVLFSGYAILDGFDLGAGAILTSFRKDEDRRLILNAIGPVWDGNEVWLITAGGALFAAFPPVYATVFSGFYLAFMLLLLALITRAVSIEFRGKQKMVWWRKTWDTAFCASSILASLLIGVAVANILWGIPLDAKGNFTGNLLTLLHPYALLLGVATVALFAMHGTLYLVVKTEGDLQARLRTIARICTAVFVVLITAHAVATVILVPHATTMLDAHPWLYSIAALAAVSVGGVIVFLKKRREGWAFLSSCSMMGCLMGLFGLAMFPLMVYSNPNPEHSISIYNGASTHHSLAIMTVIAIIGVPLVLAYSAAVYWVFRGKVKLNEHSY